MARRRLFALQQDTSSIESALRRTGVDEFSSVMNNGTVKVERRHPQQIATSLGGFTADHRRQIIHGSSLASASVANFEQLRTTVPPTPKRSIAEISGDRNVPNGINSAQRRRASSDKGIKNWIRLGEEDYRSIDDANINLMPPPPPRQLSNLRFGLSSSARPLHQVAGNMRPSWSSHRPVTSHKPDLSSRWVVGIPPSGSSVPSSGPQGPVESSYTGIEVPLARRIRLFDHATNHHGTVSDTRCSHDGNNKRRAPWLKTEPRGCYPIKGNTSGCAQYPQSDQHSRSVVNPMKIRSGFNAPTEFYGDCQKHSSLLPAGDGELQPARVSYRTPPRSQGSYAKSLPHSSARGYGFSTHRRSSSRSGDLSRHPPILPQAYTSRTIMTPMTSPHFKISPMGSGHGYAMYDVPIRRSDNLFVDQMNRISQL